MTTLAMPEGWHEQTEWEGQWHHAEGYAAGWAAAELAIADEICRALGRPAADRATIIRWLVDGIGQAAPKPLPAHPGGAVAWEPE